jgi:dipeptidyl aminopeptidase/acylaminoacyl peptidase
MTTESSDDSVPSWSGDGKYIYFASDRSGEQQIWKVPTEGGPAVQVTRQGGFVAFESGDGKYLYYCKGLGLGVWRLPVEGGEEVPILLNQPMAGCWGQWTVADDGIYFIKMQSPSSIDFFSFSKARITTVVGLDKVNGFVSGFAISPDHHQVLYAQRDPIDSDIMLVENFR